MVEPFLGKANGTAHNMVSGSRVGTYGSDSIPVNRDRITGGAGSWGVSAEIPSAKFEFLEAVVMGDLIPFGMKHVAVSVPNLGVARTLPLFHDFLQRNECSGKTVNRDDAPAATVEVLVSDLSRWVAAEDIRLAEASGKLAKSSLDRLPSGGPLVRDGCSIFKKASIASEPKRNKQISNERSLWGVGGDNLAAFVGCLVGVVHPQNSED